MSRLKSTVKKCMPVFLLSARHFLKAYMAAMFYGFPGRKMIIIGVCGTRGKTTTANFIWSILTVAGYKAGLIGTANIRVGERETMNFYHMTMPGPFILQKLLKEMKDSGCQAVVMEVPSEGVEQWRHRGINFDVAVMTALYPEYLETHGWSYERCKQMHLKIFDRLNKQKRKIIAGIKIPKVIVLNNDNKEKDLFSKCQADKAITYALKSPADLKADILETSEKGVKFSAEGGEYELKIPGEFNVYNALAAIAVAKSLGISGEFIKKGLASISSIPGRMERIEAGQKFSVIVDYAHDAVSIEVLLKAAQKIKKSANSKIIILLGAEGGGRDKTKRPVMGELAAKMADYLVISNVDPYDDDPVAIMEDIAVSAEKSGKIRNKNLFVIEDRREGIKKAVELAGEGDVILLTGKGAEQSMIVGNRKIFWDDRKIAREILDKMN